MWPEYEIFNPKPSPLTQGIQPKTLSIFQAHKPSPFSIFDQKQKKKENGLANRTHTHTPPPTHSLCDQRVCDKSMCEIKTLEHLTYLMA